jgi:AcrR family transcriptional regulator
VSSVDAAGRRRKPYHHGALHAALIDASIALAREGGPDRVVLREAARAAGVSHSAAYRHFADREALLAEVSQRARNELAAEMGRRVKRARDPRQRLRAVGTAYVEFALSEPGLFRTAFTSHPATSPSDDHDPTTPPEANSDTDRVDPYEILGQVPSAIGRSPRPKTQARRRDWRVVSGSWTRQPAARRTAPHH